ncbi:MAG: hypothetical protein OHK0048_03550 [Rhodoferax sp.]
MNTRPTPAAQRCGTHTRLGMAALCALLLGACASAPPTPAWQLNAFDNLKRATQAYLDGDSRVAALEYARAESEAAKTARPELLARLALVRCAAQVASLDFAPCSAFVPADAAPPERAYAAWLYGTSPLPAAQVALLPPVYQGLAQARDAAQAHTALANITDPLSRLIGAAVLYKSELSSQASIGLAVDTATQQGWRRPLMAWLGLQLELARKAGQHPVMEQVQRRLQVLQTPAH